MRSEIRLREGRIKPIDVLSKHLDGSDDFDIEINEPYMVFKVILLCNLFLLHKLFDFCSLHLFCFSTLLCIEIFSHLYSTMSER